MKKRITAILTALLMLAQFSLTACSNTGSAEEQNGGATAPSANADAGDAAEPEETRIDPGLPEKDFGGYD